MPARPQGGRASRRDRGDAARVVQRARGLAGGRVRFRPTRAWLAKGIAFLGVAVRLFPQPTALECPARIRVPALSCLLAEPASIVAPDQSPHVAQGWVAGGGAVPGALALRHARRPRRRRRTLDADARAILAALRRSCSTARCRPGPRPLPRFARRWSGSSRRSRVCPAVRKELDELFALLAFAPTRCLVAGVGRPGRRPHANRSPPSSRAAHEPLCTASFRLTERCIRPSWARVRQSPRLACDRLSGPPSLGTGNR